MRFNISLYGRNSKNAKPMDIEGVLPEMCCIENVNHGKIWFSTFYIDINSLNELEELIAENGQDAIIHIGRYKGKTVRLIHLTYGEEILD